MGRTWTAIGVLALASVALFGGALVLDEAFFFRDVLHYYWPTRTAVGEAWRALEVPQWNPGQGAGMPLLGDIHAGVLYPPNLLYLALPFTRAYAWLLVLHHVAAGAGVWLWLRQRGLDALAAAAGALAFMLSGSVISLANFGPLMSGAAYLPWVLWAWGAERAPAARVAWVAGLLALQALSGDPQSVVYTALAAGCLWAWGGEKRRSAGVLAAGFALAGLVAAAQLLPAWQLLRESTRAAPTGEVAGQWAFHPLRFAELFLSSPYGHYLSQPKFWIGPVLRGPASIPFALSVYWGGASLVLAALGVSRGRDSRAALTLIAVGLLLALGPSIGLGFLFTSVPPFRFFRYPEKYVLVAALGFSLLVALGVSRLARGEVTRRRPWVLAGVVGALAALLGWSWMDGPGAAGLFSSLLSALHSPFPAEGAVSSARSALGTAVGVMLAALGCVFLARRHPSKPGPRVLAVAVLAVDLLAAARPLVWTAPAALFSRPPVADALEALAPRKPFRFWRDPELKDAAPHSRDFAELTRLRGWEVATLKSNLGGAFGLEEIGSYGAVELRRNRALQDALKALPARHAELLNGCFLLTSEAKAGALAASTGFQQARAFPGERLALLRSPDCAPRIRAVERIVGVGSEDEAARRVAEPGFQPRAEALVEGEADATFAPATVELEASTPRGARARVRVPPGGGFAVFAASLYPGWTVRVDGAPAVLLPVNVASMGVRLAPGEHEVAFHFADPWLLPGALLSALGLAALAGLGLLARRERRRPPREPHAAALGSNAAAP